MPTTQLAHPYRFFRAGEFASATRIAKGMEIQDVAALFDISVSTARRRESGHIAISDEDLQVWVNLAGHRVDPGGLDEHFNQQFPAALVPWNTPAEDLGQYVLGVGVFYKRGSEELARETKIGRRMLKAIVKKELQAPAWVLHRLANTYPLRGIGHEDLAEHFGYPTLLSLDHRNHGTVRELIEAYRDYYGETDAEFARRHGLARSSFLQHLDKEQIPVWLIRRVLEDPNGPVVNYDAVAENFGLPLAQYAHPKLCRSLGSHLQARRAYYGLTQEKFGAPLNKAKSEISNYERDLVRPSHAQWQAIIEQYPLPGIDEDIVAAAYRYPFRATIQPTRNKTLGEQIEALRRYEGISQPELAIRLGVSESTVANAEKNKYRHRARFIREVLAACTSAGVTYESIARFHGLPTADAIINAARDGHRARTLRAVREYHDVTREEFAQPLSYGPSLLFDLEHLRVTVQAGHLHQALIHWPIEGILYDDLAEPLGFPTTKSLHPKRQPDLGAYLIGVRKLHGVSQQEVASRTGRVQTTISDYENNRLLPPIEYLDVFAAQYPCGDVTGADIARAVGHPQAPPVSTDLPEIEKLIYAHVGIVRAQAWKFTRDHYEAEELGQVAALGLVRLARRWDSSGDFAELAIMRAHGDIKNYLARQGAFVRVPEAEHRLGRNIQETESRLALQLGRKATLEEVAFELDIEEATIISVKTSLNQASRPTSLDAHISPDGDSLTLADRFGDFDHGFSVVDARSMATSLLSLATPREAQILQLRFAGELNDEQIAQHTRLAVPHVGVIEQRALARLRAQA